MTPRVLVVEDEPHFRTAFADAVRSAGDLELVGVASDLPEGLRLLTECRPDVLLVDIGLPSGSGIDLIRQAVAQVPNCEAMVITIFADEQAVLACIEAGATGYLLKDARGVDIAKEIRLLYGGGSPISPSIARKLLARVGGRQAAPVAAGKAVTDSPPSSTVSLSAQERAVLEYSAKGYRFDEIAVLMGLSSHTVETYVKRIYRKLQVHSKTEALYEARQLGLMRD
jgi:DNA-binding NarL/FixJ family response regulator